MNLGVGSNPNWKQALGNFLVVCGVQVVFRVDEVLNTGRLPTVLELVKIASNSLVVTLIFYGYNKLKKEGEAE